jgi:hypothetical protein
MTAALARKPKPLSLDRKTFKRLFKVVDGDYFEVSGIIAWFNKGTGLDKRFRNYRQSPKTQAEVVRWTNVLQHLLGDGKTKTTADFSAVVSADISAQNCAVSLPDTTEQFCAVVLLESGETGEGILGTTSGKIHRVLIPHFLEWLQKGSDYALAAWWQVCQFPPPRPKPQPLQLSLELRESSKAVRRSLTDLYKEWWDSHPGESKAPNFGTYCWQRENQLMQALFGKSITALKAEYNLDGKASLRDFLPAEWLIRISAVEEAIAPLLEADIPPKAAIETAVKILGKQAQRQALLSASSLEPIASTQ